MIKKNLKTKFVNLEKVRGAMIFDYFNPGISHILKNSGCEFVIYDMEHGGLSLESFKTLSVTSRGVGIYPLIRIPSLQYHFISRSLDLGAYGVMVPMVKNKNEANSIVSFSKYPPNGIRGAGFGFVHDNYISTEPIDVMKQSNENLINIIQIETKEGLDNIDEIAKLDGVDCLWVGHFDLTNFLGVPGDFRSKIYKDAITKIKNAANHNKKSLGIMVSNKKDFEYYDNFGFNIIAVGTEMSILQNAIKNLIN